VPSITIAPEFVDVEVLLRGRGSIPPKIKDVESALRTEKIRHGAQASHGRRTAALFSEINILPGAHGEGVLELVNFARCVRCIRIQSDIRDIDGESSGAKGWIIYAIGVSAALTGRERSPGQCRHVRDAPKPRPLQPLREQLWGHDVLLSVLFSE